MSRKALPFLVAPKQEIRAIGNPEIGIIHLIKKGGISPNENPVVLQEEGNRQAKVQLMLQKAVERLAEEESISKAEARKRLFADPSKSAENGKVADDSEEAPSLYDHLTPDESAQLLSLRENTAAIAIKAATLFIRYRVAYPVQLASSAKAKATALQLLSPLSFPIADGQKIKFGNLKAEADGAQYPGAEELKIQSLAGAIAESKIGYLCDLETGKTLIGNEEWTEEDTREYLTEDLILAIYNFYQAEMSGIEEKVEPEATEESEGKSLALASSAA